MEVRIITWDENGIGRGHIDVPEKTIAITIVDDDREISYDVESHEVVLEKDGNQVQDFSADPVEPRLVPQPAD